MARVKTRITSITVEAGGGFTRPQWLAALGQACSVCEASAGKLCTVGGRKTRKHHIQRYEPRCVHGR